MARNLVHRLTDIQRRTVSVENFESCESSGVMLYNALSLRITNKDELLHVCGDNSVLQTLNT